ncbi:uncharacterized protein EI90DRAFT_3043162 [Cantharellus anzutake]|uniref:uncharacterized protein n=1 Tax=Cantharellus anzutake TaxID=1750568 RepID=UPI001906E3C2|nr:uncharacterized protein EI90DRAFT_3043162 [Cantharellus anzutake]KAF8337492.1 hypothetical protein EI90DRAFT_3043162 [Cantharellus anzutake]
MHERGGRIQLQHATAGNEKLEYVRTLEGQVADLEKERDDFKARCDKAEEKIQWLKEMLMDGRGAGRSTSSFISLHPSPHSGPTS